MANKLLADCPQFLLKLRILGIVSGLLVGNDTINKVRARMIFERWVKGSNNLATSIDTK